MTNLAVSDYLTREDDGQVGGSAPVVVTGFAGWVPATAPSAAESFFGVDRSVDSRLYGNYYDGSALSVEEALINGQSFGAQVGGKVDTIFLNHSQFRKLKVELGTKEWIQKPAMGDHGKAVQDVNFHGIRIMGDMGPIDVIPANKCQGTIGWALDLSSWCLASLGTAPKLLESDGLMINRQASSDGYEVRVGARCQVGCKAPGRNAHILLPT